MWHPGLFSQVETTHCPCCVTISIFSKVGESFGWHCGKVWRKCTFEDVVTPRLRFSGVISTHRSWANVPSAFLGRWDKGGISVTKDVSAHLHNLHFNNVFTLTLTFCWHRERLQVNHGTAGTPHGTPAACLPSGHGTERGCSATQLWAGPTARKESLGGIHHLPLLARLSLVCHRLGRRVPTSSASTHMLVMHPLWVCLSCSVNSLRVFEKHWDCVRHHHKQVTAIATCDGFLHIPTAQDCLLCLVFMIAHLPTFALSVNEMQLGLLNQYNYSGLFLQPACFLISWGFFGFFF